MDLSYNTGHIFPVPIHVLDVKDFKLYQKDLIDYAYTLKSEDPNTPKRSNVGGWQSKSFNLNDKNDKLHSLLIGCISSLPALRKDINLYVKAWVNINNLGSFNVQHNHPGCDLSGVLWVKCPKECGNIVFYSPSLFETFQEIESYTQDFKDKNNYHHNYFFPPLEGRMLIFPSHLQHEVKKNLSNEDRISVSFNIKLEDKK